MGECHTDIEGSPGEDRFTKNVKKSKLIFRFSLHPKTAVVCTLDCDWINAVELAKVILPRC